MKTKLTIEESARLIELGVDAKLATHVVFRDIEAFPIFQLQDLLSILPKEIDDYELNISSDKQLYFVSYILWDWAENYGTHVRDTIPDKQFYAPELIDALNQLAIWTIEQGYLKTEKK